MMLLLLLLRRLQLERSDVDHRVGVDFAPGGAFGDGLAGVTAGRILDLTAWWGTEDAS